MDTSSLKLSDFVDHRRESVRMVARFLSDGSAMTSLQMAHQAGMADESMRNAAKLLHKHKLIHIDRWVRAEQARAKPVPVWRIGNQPDATKELRKQRSFEQRERHKEKQRLKRLAEKQAKETNPEIEWNNIMNSFVKAHPLEK